MLKDAYGLACRRRGDRTRNCWVAWRGSDTTNHYNYLTSLSFFSPQSDHFLKYSHYIRTKPELDSLLVTQASDFFKVRPDPRPDPSLAVARPRSILDCTLFWGGCCHFLQHKRRDQVQLTLYAIGCLPSLACRHCVKPANSVPGGGKPAW